MKIAFPLDWRNDETAFWIATIFLFTDVFLAISAILLSMIIWYLMLNCSLRYELLGIELKRLGEKNEKRMEALSNKEKQNMFRHDLKVVVDTHVHIRR